MSGAALGGFFLDHFSIAVPLIGSTVLLVASSLVVGNGNRLKPSCATDTDEVAPWNLAGLIAPGQS